MTYFQMINIFLILIFCIFTAAYEIANPILLKLIESSQSILSTICQQVVVFLFKHILFLGTLFLFLPIEIDFGAYFSNSITLSSSSTQTKETMESSPVQ